MSRRSKIARLPRNTRDELNQRLDDGEAGVALIDWLNSLPEVKQVLDAHFSGHPITDGNLSDWKKGGFREWQIDQKALSFVEQHADEPATAQLAKPLGATVLAHYAAALAETDAIADEDPRDRVRRLGKSIRDIVRVCRCQQDRDRVEIQRERLALGNKWLELEQSKIKIQNSKIRTPSAPDLDSMTPQERSDHIKKIIYGD